MAKYFYSLIIIYQFACSLYADDWGPATNGIQMSINSTSRVDESKINQPIVLSVCFRNVSTNETFRIYQANAVEFDPGYSWSVISPSGKDISPNMQKINPSESGGFIPLLVNKTYQFQFNLSHICKFTEVGTYKIIAEKAIYSVKSRKTIVAVSNPLNVTVSN